MTTQKTATFSNGSTNTYGGKRDVTAAWAIINPSTNETVATGFSLDREKAAKTASGHHELRVDVMIPGRAMAGHQAAHRAGFRNVTEYNDDVKRRNAEHAAKFRIEVVSV